ncbi:MAG: hypothetical protein H0A75_07450 [Candidatus Methanofishera endochildressiae]|jgi:hypothetical protein|uniref:HTH-like domain-containing protein n=1 Tax=Candidatus Methanofishera endochildressiae TaxID=2738884 RepID=A0A7Z0MPQ7_9GAMM|nr:hypothetical protein [Candidatus Methanofishera endochildressiae]
MRVSTSAYYAWTNNPDRQNKTKKETELKAKIEQIFYANKQVYGSRRMLDALSNTTLRQDVIK